ncbi:MAG: fatty acid desaturase [Solirubrobacterales bacterium]|nr:fatty acid desaturase [Solirubrobacterales bacterium]
MSGSSTDSIRTIPDPQEPVPLVALPTLLLFVSALTMYVGSCWLVVAGVMAWPFGTVINGLAGYMMFTVTHEASHHSASSNTRFNNLLGHLALPFFAPPIGYRAFRFIHMQHHQHTNKVDGSDPDEWTMAGGNRLSTVLRWATLDLHYIVYYLPRFSKRPAVERAQAAVEFTLWVGVVAAIVISGHFFDLLVLYLIPSRLTITFLGLAFDYLPHRGLDATPKENKFQATRNRIGLEGVLKFALLYQNYHLVHHLHPVVPFYRYIRVWRRSEDEYLSHDPALSTVSGRSLTVDEYRQLRELQAHH